MHLRDHKTVESIIKVFSIKYAYGIFSGLVSSLIVLVLFFGKVKLRVTLRLSGENLEQTLSYLNVNTFTHTSSHSFYSSVQVIWKYLLFLITSLIFFSTNIKKCLGPTRTLIRPWLHGICKKSIPIIEYSQICVFLLGLLESG